MTLGNTHRFSYPGYAELMTGAPHDTVIDRSDQIGLFSSDTLEIAEKQCETFMDSLDFEANFDPAAWK